MNKENNLAGHTLVVDRVKELKGKKSDYIRQVTKTAQANKKIDEKETQEFYIKALPSTIERDDVRRDSQTIVLQAIVNGYKDPVPNFEINGLPRMCGYHTGDTKATLITTLESYITNQTPYTPNFSGTNNWSRGGALFTVGDTVSVCYLCSDNSYVTAIMTVTTVNTSTITGTVNSIVYTLEGFDDRDTTNTQLHIPYAQAVPLDIVLYNGNEPKDTLRLEVQNTTRHRKTFGTDSQNKGSTYTENGIEYNFIEGDSYVEVSIAGGTKTAVVKFRYQNSWWNIDLFRDYARYDEILTESLPDVFSIYQGETHVQASGYDWFKQVIAEHISAVYYFVGGAIYGYGPNGQVDMNQPVGQRVTGDAFIIDANGIMEISSGYARNLNVRGILNLYADNGTDAGADILHPALTTVAEINNADPVGVTINTPAVAWPSSSFINAMSAVTKNSLQPASGTFKQKTIAYYAYIDDMSAELYSGANYERSLVGGGTFYYTIPEHPSKNKYLSIIFWYAPYQFVNNVISVRASRLYVNNNLVVSTPEGINQSFAHQYEGLKSGDSIRLELEGSSSYSAYFSIRTPKILAEQYASSTGFWVEYTDETVEKIENDTAYLQSSHSLIMSSPESYSSNDYVNLRSCSDFINYSSYVDTQSVPQTIQIGRAYKITSSNLRIDGNTVIGISLIRNSSTSVEIRYLFAGATRSITLNSSGYYNVEGTIAIAKTLAGVEMMGNYPKEDMTYDTGSSGRVWLNGYIANIESTSKRSEKEDITDYERNALDILNGTKIVRFKYIKDKKHQPHIGFIADDTDSDLSGEDHESFIANHVISVCVKAIQELSAEVEQLKTEIQNLKG